MPLRSRTIRISDRAWDTMRAEADREGISVNQWVSEAAVARLTYVLTRRDEPIAQAFDEIFECLRQLRDE